MTMSVTGMQWFGRPFNAACEDGNEVPVPVGRDCAWCDETIDADHSGAILPQLSFKLGSISYLIYHHECFFRGIIGSVGHQQHECSCYGGVDTSEIGLTLREAALQSWQYAIVNRRKETVH